MRPVDPDDEETSAVARNATIDATAPGTDGCWPTAREPVVLGLASPEAAAGHQPVVEEHDIRVYVRSGVINDVSVEVPHKRFGDLKRSAPGEAVRRQLMPSKL